MAGVGLLCLRGAPEVSEEIVGTLEQGPSWGTSGTLLHFLVALPGRDLHAFLLSIPSLSLSGFLSLSLHFSIHL